MLHVKLGMKIYYDPKYILFPCYSMHSCNVLTLGPRDRFDPTAQFGLVGLDHMYIPAGMHMLYGDSRSPSWIFELVIYAIILICSVGEFEIDLCLLLL